MQVATKAAADELLRRRGPKCLWPSEYSEDSLECCIAFVLQCWTETESEKGEEPIPEWEFVLEYIKLWYENRKRRGTMITEKCRRMVVSWTSRACELWDMGLQKCSGVLAGPKLRSAAKQIYRYVFLYNGLARRHSDWKLGKLKTWQFEGSKFLTAIELPNGSHVGFANGEDDGVQGDGYAFVILEEFSLYPYASGFLSQAKIIVQGKSGGKGGYVHAICNAKASNANWQRVKGVLKTGVREQIMDGLTRRVSGSGEWFVELDWWADKNRDEEWLEATRLEMLSQPFEFREQILRIDTQSEGALWNHDLIDASRRKLEDLPDIVTLIVSVDPSVSDPEMRKNPSKKPDACGIVVGGVCANAQGWVLNDLTILASPDRWAKVAIKALQKYAKELKPDRWLLVAEKNQGGELVRQVLRTVWPNAPIELVHAATGKRPRAEPLVALYEQDRFHHVGRHGELESEMCTWNALDPSAPSPNRVDALVWLAWAGRLCGDMEIRTHSRLSEANDERRST